MSGLLQVTTRPASQGVQLLVALPGLGAELLWLIRGTWCPLPRGGVLGGSPWTSALCLTLPHLLGLHHESCPDSSAPSGQLPCVCSITPVVWETSSQVTSPD